MTPHRSPRNIAAALRKLPGVAERLLACSIQNVQLDVADVQEATGLLHRMDEYSAKDMSGEEPGILKSKSLRLALLQIVAVTLRSATGCSGRLDINSLGLSASTLSTARIFLSVLGGENIPPAEVFVLACSLLRMQSLQCCTQQLAKAAAAASAAKTSAQQQVAPAQAGQLLSKASSSSASSASSAADRRAARVELLARFDIATKILEALTLPLEMMMGSIAERPTEIQPPPWPSQHQQHQRHMQFQSYLLELSISVRDSCLLEHCAAAVAQMLQLLAAAEAAGEPAHFPGELDFEHAQDNFFMAVSSLQTALWSLSPTAGAPPPPPLTAADVDVIKPALSQALSGPCMRHWVLTGMVTSLCAADGGPSYGMPPVLLRGLPVPGYGTNLLYVADVRSLSGKACLHGSIMARLACTLQHSRPDAIGPSNRVALELLLRLGRLAVASARLLKGEESSPPLQPQPASPLQLTLEYPDVAPMALEVLRCGFERLPARGPRRQAALTELWRLAVDVLYHMCPFLKDEHIAMLEQWLESAVQPQSGTAMAAWTAVSPLPAEPPPNVAAALAGSPLPCLERLIRRFGRDLDGTLGQLLQSKWLCGGGVNGLLVQMLLYGDTRQALALITSIDKVAHVSVSAVTDLQGGKPDLPDLADGGNSSGNSNSDGDCGGRGGFVLGLDGCRMAVVFSAPACLLAAARAAADGGGNPEALRHVAAVMSHACHRWGARVQLPDGGSGDATVETRWEGIRARGPLRQTLLPWIGLLVPMDPWDAPPAAAALAGDGGGGGVAGIGGGGIGGGDGGIDGGGSGRVPPAESWRTTALRSLDVLVVLGHCLRLHEYPDQVPKSMRLVFEGSDDGNPDADASRLQLLAGCLCRVARALPDDVRRAAVEGAALHAPLSWAGRRDSDATRGSQRRARGSRGGRGGGGGAAGSSSGGGGGRCDDGAAMAVAFLHGPLSYWPPDMVRSLGTKLHAHGRQTAAKAVEALAAQLERWAAGRDMGAGAAACGPLWRAVELPAVEPYMAVAARSLLSPAAAAALLRSCANPACANLEGNSEAELRLAACGRCGAVGYCCRECQVAHWHAGHKAECASRVRAAGSAAVAGAAGG